MMFIIFWTMKVFQKLKSSNMAINSSNDNLNYKNAFRIVIKKIVILLVESCHDPTNYDDYSNHITAVVTQFF